MNYKLMWKPTLCLLFIILAAAPSSRNTGQSIQSEPSAQPFKSQNQLLVKGAITPTHFDSIYRYYPDEIAVPQFTSSLPILRRKGFTIGYDRSNFQARWVAYMLTRQELDGMSKRSNHFYLEPELADYSAVDADYKKSGFDRGHLAPAADMAWSEHSMHESFSYANVSPQTPAFNRGIWKKLEEQVRAWSRKFDTVWVVTGPVFDSINIQRLNQKISIPGHFYKALLSHHQQRWYAIAFLMPNQASTRPVQQYAVSVNRLEEMTTIDFFHLLPDSVENAIEEDCTVNYWFTN